MHEVSVLIKTFDYLFGNMLGEYSLRLTNNLSSTLQSNNLSALKGQPIASMTLDSFQMLRSDAQFVLFWMKVSNMEDSQHFRGSTTLTVKATQNKC